MTAVAEFAVDAEEFPLGRLFAGFPDVRVELERLIPTNEGMVPYVWIHDVTREAIEEAVDRHPALVTVEIVDSLDGTHLCRLVWDPAYEGTLTVLAESDVTLLSASRTAESWTIELRATERRDIAEIQNRFRDHDVRATLRNVHSFLAVGVGDGVGLTAAQREALRLAHERGYFERPRRVTQADLAVDLGISPQAVGSRIQRALSRLLDAVFD